MAEIVHPKKALAVNPLKVSQPVGASLAFLGLARAVPLMHGSQGCTAFGKVFFVRHFREPIPLQTTAMDQVSTIMGADENVVEALRTLCEKNSPEVIGLVTTGLSETQGTDIHRAVRDFRTAHPEYAATAVVAVNTPDYVGCFESGHALAVEAIINTLVAESDAVGRRQRQVNVLASSMLTPGDIEAIREWTEAFGLRAIVLPDIGDALDGHLTEAEFSPLTLGGTPASEIAIMGESVATLVIGGSLNKAADLLKARTGVPDWRFDSLMGLDACDDFTMALAQISGRPVPPRIDRHRAQLQDAMVDCHFMLGFARVALAGDPDLLIQMGRFLVGVGAEVVAAVSPAKAERLAGVPCEKVIVGDLEDLENHARGAGVQLLVANSHGTETARRLGVPLLHAGFPLYDLVGGYARTWVGYRAARQALFDLANIQLGQHHEIEAYRSFYRDDPAAGESHVCTPPAIGVVH
ncbi:nitrogenase iron-molybdenum cofactor biosynthesis protein NifN [Cognatazoarcus halotolerans]|uniref:nitrogenase iron-molybdenum cofactor biosynthesis protein NifN n=1 Tax=Cognatazoarcus halotolerans TaxID=2686016 RepID=UPI00135AE752|nr:nitrogenase iron-molybdenum cofactor biosynthesis protein NifN [Cognatazoarcus halotolerans]MCB1900723.1 nitrogenase iron-molybdenum cofactor biosynthesis protein NifN [Rhodocyclaceae bacterium]MCP5308438.1 nitrogenase iron-molybdenum cofactor biosynthesis protein NifN [Zoogloeaceae bacterium]